MKIISLVLILLAMSFQPLIAMTTQDYQRQINEGTLKIPEANIPEYLGTNIVPLNPKERKALQLTNSWTAKGIAPFLAGNGKLVYVYGASTVTILASPMQISNVELEQGEMVNEIVVGDSARWMVESGKAGNVTHIFIKPVDAGLKTSAVITTDRRVYHLRLISHREDFTPYVGFVYMNDLQRFSTQKQEAQNKTNYYGSTNIDGRNVNLLDLNFAYKISGNASWKPERVYDDGLKTFIRLPKKTKSNEMPILLVRKGKKDVLVNYRVQEQAMIVDGTFDKIVLIVGIGRNKEQISIKRVL